MVLIECSLLDSTKVIYVSSADTLKLSTQYTGHETYMPTSEQALAPLAELSPRHWRTQNTAARLVPKLCLQYLASVDLEVSLLSQLAG